MDTREVRIYLTNTLAMADIAGLCSAFFNLDHEILPGQAKGDKIRELVLWCGRRGYADRLVAITAVIQILAERFNTEEINNVAFDLGIDLEAMPGGSGKTSQIVKLMVTLEDARRFDTLLAWLRRNRPDIQPPRALHAG